MIPEFLFPMNKLIILSLLVFAAISTEFDFEDGVLALDGTNFDKALEKYPRIMLYVYMTGCKHCVEFAPKYVKAA